MGSGHPRQQVEAVHVLGGKGRGRVGVEEFKPSAGAPWRHMEERSSESLVAPLVLYREESSEKIQGLPGFMQLPMAAFAQDWSGGDIVVEPLWYHRSGTTTSPQVAPVDRAPACLADDATQPACTKQRCQGQVRGSWQGVTKRSGGGRKWAAVPLKRWGKQSVKLIMHWTQKAACVYQ